MLKLPSCDADGPARAGAGTGSHARAGDSSAHHIKKTGSSVPSAIKASAQMQRSKSARTSHLFLLQQF